MKQLSLIIVLSFLFTVPVFSQQIFFEDFQGEANGATSGSGVGANWSTTYGGSGSFSRQLDLFYGNVFRAVNLDAEAVWTVDPISTTGTVVIDIGDIATGNDVNAGDYLRFYYIRDSDPAVMFYELTSASGGTQTTFAVSNITSSIQIFARVMNSDAISLILNDDRFVFDDVEITHVQTLYSIADNVNWNATGTWSTVSHAGASCGCVPDETTSVVIGDNDRINLPSTQNVHSVYITTTGTLRFTASTIQLNLLYGGGFTVESGGIFTSNGQTAVGLGLGSEYDYTITNNGTISISNFQINSGQNVTFSGGGTLTITGNFDFNDEASVTFSTSGAVNINTAIDNDPGEDATLTFNTSGVFTVPLINIGAATTLNFNNSAAFNITNDINIDENTTINFGNSVAVAVTDDFIIADTDPVTINGTGSLTIGDELTLNDNLTKNGTGTIAITGRIYFTNDETLDINAGTVTAGSVYFDGDNADIANSGILTIAGDIGATDFNRTDNTVTNDAGATVTFVNLDGTVGADAGGIGGSLKFFNSGTVNQSGNFLDIDLLARLANLATGVWNWSMVNNSGFDVSIEQTTVFDLDDAGNTFNYNGATGTQTVVSKTYHHVGFSGIDPGGTNVVKSFKALAAPDFNGNVTISEEAQLDINTNDVSLTIGGDFTISSTNPDPFIDGNGTGNPSELVTFDGSGGDQTLTLPAAGEMFQRLRVNKTSGNLILVNNLTIRNYSLFSAVNELQLTQGKLMTSASSLLILQDDVSTSGGDADSYVDGPVQKDGDDPFIFPTGDGTQWARIAITAPGSTQSFTAEYFNSSYADVTSDGTLDHASAAEYWSLTSTGGSARVRLYWQSATASQINTSATSDLRIARYNGTDWTDVGAATATGTTTGNIFLDAATSTFGLFTFGSEANLNVLPISLLSFEVSVDGNEVITEWVTAQEINNDFFTIEKSSDGEIFSEVGIVKGRGNSTEELAYFFTDSKPYPGRSYYRLKQTDFDGTFTYSKIRSVIYDGPVATTVEVYPTLTTAGEDFTIEVRGLKSEYYVPLEIFNQEGQKVYETFLPPQTGQIPWTKLVSNAGLGSGLYMVRLGETKIFTTKFVIH